MPTTYPIHPGDRLQRRLVSVLSSSLTGSAFTGFSFVNDREEDEVNMPLIVVRQGESQNNPTGSHLWHVTMTVQMMEDRKDADDAISGDSRPRHELRTENVSARLFGQWNGSTLAEAVNAISNGQGVYVLKVYGQNQASMNDIDMLSTEWTLTFICTATEQ